MVSFLSFSLFLLLYRFGGNYGVASSDECRRGSKLKCERFRHATNHFLLVNGKKKAHENMGAESPRSRNTLTSVFLVDVLYCTVPVQYSTALARCLP